MTVVPWAAISRKRDVPKSATLHMSFSVTSTLAGPQIAVDHALPVRMIDGVADLAGEVERPVHVQRAGRRDDVLERLARHVLHDDEEDVVFFFRRDDGDDVGMADAGEQARLVEQLAEVHVLPVRDLDRDALVDPGVLRQVHGAEATAAERRDDLVLAEVLALEEQCCC